MDSLTNTGDLARTFMLQAGERIGCSCAGEAETKPVESRSAPPSGNTDSETGMDTYDTQWVGGARYTRMGGGRLQHPNNY